MMVRRLYIDLPDELGERLDKIVKLLDYGSEERFIEVAVRRLLDEYTILARELVKTG